MPLHPLRQKDAACCKLRLRTQAAAPEDKPAPKDVLELRAELLSQASGPANVGAVGDGWGRGARKARDPHPSLRGWWWVVVGGLSSHVPTGSLSFMQLGWAHHEQQLRRRLMSAYPPGYPLF